MSESGDHDLVAVLESIFFSDIAGIITTLHSNPFKISNDSTIPELSLPEQACTKFEDAFGLRWNSTVGRYLINDTHHEVLQQQNTHVTLRFGSDESGVTSIDITLPYSAFDLELDFPLNGTKQKYFPLLRATNATQYTLGRTFLQEAYFSFDFGKKHMLMHPGIWSLIMSD